MNDNAVKSEIAESWNKEAAYYDTHVSHSIQIEEEKLLWMNAFQTVLPLGDNLSILDGRLRYWCDGADPCDDGTCSLPALISSEEMMAIGRKRLDLLIFQ